MKETAEVAAEAMPAQQGRACGSIVQSRVANLPLESCWGKMQTVSSDQH